MVVQLAGVRLKIVMDLYGKCKSCEHYDAEKSNDNWMVCNGRADIVIGVLLSGTSKDCDNYKAILANK